MMIKYNAAAFFALISAVNGQNLRRRNLDGTTTIAHSTSTATSYGGGNAASYSDSTALNYGEGDVFATSNADADTVYGGWATAGANSDAVNFGDGGEVHANSDSDATTHGGGEATSYVNAHAAQLEGNSILGFPIPSEGIVSASAKGDADTIGSGISYVESDADATNNGFLTNTQAHADGKATTEYGLFAGADADATSYTSGNLGRTGSVGTADAHTVGGVAIATGDATSVNEGLAISGTFSDANANSYSLDGVATSGSYADSTNKPSGILSRTVSDSDATATAYGGFADATSGASAKNSGILSETLAESNADAYQDGYLGNAKAASHADATTKFDLEQILEPTKTVADSESAAVVYGGGSADAHGTGTATSGAGDPIPFIPLSDYYSP